MICTYFNSTLFVWRRIITKLFQALLKGEHVKSRYALVNSIVPTKSKHQGDCGKGWKRRFQCFNVKKHQLNKDE